MRGPADARNLVRRGATFVGSLAIVLALAYAVWAGYLGLTASEGSLPPRSRLPDVPAGARVVHETTQCASGGCWREVLLQPANKQSPVDLADQMGLTHDARHSWRVLDPHSVTTSSTINDGKLSVYVQY